jgi:hypothetical protein
LESIGAGMRDIRLHEYNNDEFVCRTERVGLYGPDGRVSFERDVGDLNQDAH